MTHVKTTISLSKPLFDRAESLASRLGMARSQLFALALEEFLRRAEGRRLLEELNAAYTDDPDEAEQAALDQMYFLHREAVDGA